jgi:hypothetical protein
LNNENEQTRQRPVTDTQTPAIDGSGQGSSGGNIIPESIPQGEHGTEVKEARRTEKIIAELNR